MRSMYVLVREFYYHMLIQFQSSLSPALNAQNAKYKKSDAIAILPDQFKTQMQTELVYTRLAGMLLPKFPNLYCISRYMYVATPFSSIVGCP